MFMLKINKYYASTSCRQPSTGNCAWQLMLLVARTSKAEGTAMSELKGQPWLENKAFSL